MTFKTTTTIKEQIDYLKKVWFATTFKKNYSISTCSINCFINRFH